MTAYCFHIREQNDIYLFWVKFHFDKLVKKSFLYICTYMYFFFKTRNQIYIFFFCRLGLVKISDLVKIFELKLHRQWKNFFFIGKTHGLIHVTK